MFYLIGKIFNLTFVMKYIHLDLIGKYNCSTLLFKHILIRIFYKMERIGFFVFIHTAQTRFLITVCIVGHWCKQNIQQTHNW